MKTIIFLLLVLISYTSCDKLFDATLLEFEKTYPVTGTNYAKSAILVGSNIYTLGTSNELGNNDFHLVKIDENGNKLFSKNYGGNAQEEGYNLIQTTDKNLLLLGISNSFSSSYAIFLVKIKPNGDTIWQKTYDTVGAFDTAEGILEAINGSFYIFGTSSNQLILMHLDAQGNQIWQRIYNSPYQETGLKIVPTNDNNYLLLSRRKDGDDDFCLLKINSLGDTLWTKIYGGVDYEEAHSIFQTKDNGYILCGHSASVDPMHNLYAVKINSDGNVLWEKHFGGAAHDGGTCAIELSNKHLIFVGETNSYNSGDRNMFLVRTDANGNSIDEKSFGGNLHDKASFVLESSTAYYLIGESNSFSATGDIDLYIVKRKK